MKRIPLKTVNIIFIAVSLIAVIIIAIAPELIWLGFGLFVGVFVFRIIFYRCPYCKVYLDRSSGRYCPHCGEVISEDK